MPACSSCSLPCFCSRQPCPHCLIAQLTPVKVLDASALNPPAGARVAIVEFDDLECPTCADYNPLLKQAAANYKIPWVRHDFLIPYHTWSRAAAVDARWFDAKSKALGDEYRDQVFANQSDIDNQGVLNQFTQKFAQSHGISLPFSLDPQGKLAAEVQADNDLGYAHRRPWHAHHLHRQQRPQRPFVYAGPRP